MSAVRVHSLANEERRASDTIAGCCLCQQFRSESPQQSRFGMNQPPYLGDPVVENAVEDSVFGHRILSKTIAYFLGRIGWVEPPAHDLTGLPRANRTVSSCVCKPN
jgi:hypothetical protein